MDYYKDIFSVFDRSGTGNITAADIGQVKDITMVLGSLGSFLSYEKVMRSLGWSPSEVEVQVSYHQNNRGTETDLLFRR